MNLAILLAAYGSRQPKALAVIENIRKRVQKIHPEATCNIAFTSHCVRVHLALCGKTADSVIDALDKLHKQCFDHVAVLSLHIVPGKEFESVLAAANEARGKGQSVTVAGPLLKDKHDVDLVSNIIAQIFSKHLEIGESVLLIGHGSSHPGKSMYTALDQSLRRRNPRLHLGFLESKPGIKAIRDRLLAQGTRSVLLLPFLFGPGYHVTKDLAGESSDSWLAVLTQAGLRCRIQLKCAGEYDELVELWLDHLNTTLTKSAK